MNSSYGTLIKQARKMRGLTQTQLGAELGLTVRQVKNIESGVSEAHMMHLRRAATILDLPLTYFGLADDRALSIDAADLLPMLWSLFYGGQTAPMQPYLPFMTAWLDRQTTTTAVHAGILSRAYQLLSTTAHDQGDHVGALTLIDRAIAIARPLRDPNDLAAALFRRARVHMRTTLPQAFGDIAAAVSHTSVCRPILAGVIHLYHARILASAERPMRDIDIALGLVGTTYGQDASGTALDASSVLHTRAQILAVRAHGDRGMLWDAYDNASGALGHTHALRWQNDIHCTLAALCVTRGDPDGALASLHTVAAVQPAQKLRTRAIQIAQQLPISTDQRALLRALRSTE